LDEAKKDLKESKTNLNSEQRMLRFLEKRLAEDNYSLRVPHLVQVKKKHLKKIVQIWIPHLIQVKENLKNNQ